MASNPPFQVEDQTDEDFFDKLVDDDDEFKATASSAVSFADGNDSDEAKAFANLSAGEVAAGSEGSGDEGRSKANKGEDTRGNVIAVLVDGRVEENTSVVSCNSFAMDGHVEEASSLVSSSSFGFDNVIDSHDAAIVSEGTSDATISERNGSVGSGVKEVQWAAFNTDSGQNDGNGFGSYSDFLTELGDGAINPTVKVNDNYSMESKIGSSGAELKTAHGDNSYESVHYPGSQPYGAATTGQNNTQDLKDIQQWENLYPGWKYDTVTGQWYQADSYYTTGNVQGSFDSNSAGDSAVSDKNSEVSYLQHTAQSFMGTVSESGTGGSLTNWNQFSHENGATDSCRNWNQVPQQSGAAEGVFNLNQVLQQNEYPAHMIFDPQYPGWYYDTIKQEWQSLETYTSSVHSAVQDHNQLSQNGFASSVTFAQNDDPKNFSDYGQVENYASQGFGAQSQDYNWVGSFSNHNQQHSNMLQFGSVPKSEAAAYVSGNQQLENDHGSYISTGTHVNQHKSYNSMGMAPAYDTATVSQTEFSTGSHGFVQSGNFSQHVDQPIMHRNEPMYVSENYLGNQNSINFPQQFPSSQQLVPTAGMSSAGRPPHALVTFGFGGKLIVAKDNSSLSVSSYGSQGHVGASISVLNLTEVVTLKFEASSTGVGSCDYFDTLCRQSFPGPLVGGNVGSREVNKWIDERIASCESSEVDYRKGEVLRLLLSLLKIACQYYGKLRSPFGTDAALKESDIPESAVAKLFASVKGNSGQFSNYSAFSHCLQQLPSEGQMQATAAEVQTLLVSGRKKEALHSASEGQLWGPALVLAAELGDQFYADTVKKMALRQLVAGSPLRTLCLLIAGQPAEVFSSDTSNSSIPGAMNTSPQLAQYGANFMLDDWEENLAVITANRTKDDELVLTHLGDCLWKDRSEIFAAHICYLVAEANFEPYSDSARLCLVGGDHWKFPRTYASPDAIQRTELFEYSKVLGNPQFTLLPFQPYKLIYAHMLAEVGKVTESLKYCQAVYKSLKTGRAPEVDTWRQLVSSLEERIRTHQQGGYSTNLAPGKLVGKLLNLFDSTAHRVVGGLPPPVPSTSHSNIQANVHHYETMVPRVSTSQSTMAMSSLMSSASVEPINELTGDGSRMTMHARSISEPDFGRTPRQADSSKETTSSGTSGKASGSGGASRFGRFSFGSQLLQKTVGLVLKARQDRQAKLGDENKFYYDENLKRWVEEGAEAPAEEAALPPPPTSAALQNGISDYNLKSALKSESSPSNGSPEFASPTLERSSGIPPIPTVQNQFSAHGRTGVRSRYVDTFNKGGGNPTNLFRSPLVPSVKPASGANPKFFVPTPVTTSEQNFDHMAASVKESAAINQDLSSLNNWTDSPASLSSTPAMLRFPSMDNISNNEKMAKGSGSLSAHSRRTASWSGSFIPEHKSQQKTNLKPLGEVLGISPSSFMPSETSSPPLTRRGGSFGDDLHEVEL